MSACVYSDGLTGYCDKLKVSSLHYLKSGFRFLRYWYWATKKTTHSALSSLSIIWFSRTLAPFIGPVWRIWLFFTYFILKRLYLRHATGIELSICHLPGRFRTGHLDAQTADFRPCRDRIRPRLSVQTISYFALHLNQVAYCRKPGHSLEGAALELTSPITFAALTIFSISCLLRGLGCFAFLSVDQLFSSRPHVKYLLKKRILGYSRNSSSRVIALRLLHIPITLFKNF